MALTDISKHAETVTQFINELAEAFRKKSWVKLLSLVGVVFAILLNPFTVEHGLGYINRPKPQWYSYSVWIIITASFFVAAFLVALLTKEKENSEPPASKSIIKGLLSYTNTKEDAEWFARLQRGNILQECLRFCEGKDFSFGIISGESGTGKSSLLQAGLLPTLENQSYRAVYVKFTDSAPLDSIRHAFNGLADGQTSDGNQRLLDLLQETIKKDARPVVLIFDQFEQFFVHHKTKAKRRHFIEQMAEWYKQSQSLPVTILISIRSDFASLMNQFQSKMAYTLTLHNNLSVEKFEPNEAAKVISVIAEEARIKFDEAFINDLTKDELADREDGTVSPVDIQILSWMLDGQKYSEERAFNRKAFQKLGGVEGLLERFLDKTLKARTTKAQRDSAISVMMALTEQNTRTGVLSSKDLKEKLQGIIPESDVEEAVLWLSRSDVRLVTPFQEKDITLYELAHERIIPSLIRLASKEITDVEKAEKLLDRRVNEWLGSNRARSYLLTFKEWRLIRRYRSLFKADKQKEQKESFIASSKIRFIKRAAICSIILLVASGSYFGYQRYENQRETQLYRAEVQLGQLLELNKETKPLQNVSLLDNVFTPVGESRKGRFRLYGIESTKEASTAFISLVNSFIKVGDNEEAIATLEQAKYKLDIGEGYYDVDNIISIAIVYSRLNKDKEALSYLNRTLKTYSIRAYDRNVNNQRYFPLLWELFSSIEENTLHHGKSYENSDLLSTAKSLKGLTSGDYTSNKINKIALAFLSKVYLMLEMNQETVNNLKQTWEPERITDEGSGSGSSTSESSIGLGEIRFKYKDIKDELGLPLRLNDYKDKIKLLISEAESYQKGGKYKEAHYILMEAVLMTEAAFKGLEIDLVPIIEIYIKLGKNEEAYRALNKALQILKEGKAEFGIKVLTSMTEQYIKLGKNEEARESFNVALEIMKKKYGYNLEGFTILIADTYIKLSDNNAAYNYLSKSSQDEDFFYRPILVWATIMELYIKLGKSDEALKRLDVGQKSFASLPEKLRNPAFVKIAVLYAKIKNWKKAVETIQLINMDGYKIMALSRVLAIGKSPEKFNLIEDLFWDNELDYSSGLY